MKKYLWQYVMSISPFIKEEDVESIEELNEWDLLITFRDGKRVMFDRHTGCHRNVFYDDVGEITEEQEKREFAYRLRSLMGRNGYTQERLAEETKITQAMISRYIRGHAIPSVMVLRRIVKVLGCSMDDFFYKNY